MSVPFEIPDWLIDTSASPTPPDTSGVDPHNVEDLVNRFIAGKQDALFTAPDAYYRTEGRDAVDGAPAILDRLNDLKNTTLDAAGDDGTRYLLGPRLDAHLDDASDGIDRHVTGQRDALTRQIIGERQTLIQRAAELEHNNDNKLAGLAEAHASAAAELARMNGEPKADAMDAARSAIWRTAIDQHLTNGSGPHAVALFDRVKGQLAPDDRVSLDTPLQVARDDHAANQWITNQTGTNGPPLQDRAVTDPNLPPDAKLLVRTKLDARDSAQESSRVATVKALDDQIADVTRTLATTPGAYKTGTLSGMARAYGDAGEPDKAAATRLLATQEAVLVPFARLNVDKQQRLIDSLSEGELRDAAIAIQRQQAAAFARDPFTAGTTLYDEVGPPVPIDNIQGRIRQARQIAETRDIPVSPFSAEEIADMRHTLAGGSQQERQAVRTRLAALPQDMTENAAPAFALKTEPAIMSDAVEEAPQPGQRYASNTRRSGGMPELTPGQQLLLGEYQYLTTSITRLEPQNRLAASISAPGWAPTRQDVEQARAELARVQQRAAQADPTARQPSSPRLSYDDPIMDRSLSAELEARLGQNGRRPSQPRGASVAPGEGQAIRPPTEPSEHPPNDGFLGPRVTETLPPGTRVDRYGGPGGNYLAPEGTPFAARSIPAAHQLRQRMVYEVVKPLEVEGGIIAPWHGQPGLGRQYFLGTRTVQDLIDSGHLRLVK